MVGVGYSISVASFPGFPLRSSGARIKRGITREALSGDIT